MAVSHSLSAGQELIRDSRNPRVLVKFCFCNKADQKLLSRMKGLFNLHF